MNNTTVYVGMDVHKESFTLCAYTLEKECASCATFASHPSARLYINGICIELDASANEAFIKNIIKTVRYA